MRAGRHSHATNVVSDPPTTQPTANPDCARNQGTGCLQTRLSLRRRPGGLDLASARRGTKSFRRARPGRPHRCSAAGHAQLAPGPDALAKVRVASTPHSQPHASRTLNVGLHDQTQTAQRTTTGCSTQQSAQRYSPRKKKCRHARRKAKAGPGLATNRVSQLARLAAHVGARREAERESSCPRDSGL